MIVTPRFVFIHLHKTGGQFINRLLLSFVPGTVRLGYHYPRSLLPGRFRALPAAGIARNPWDWYASWDAFNRTSPNRNPIFRTLSESGRLDFKTTIMRMLALGEDTAEANSLRAAIVEQLPESIIGNRGAGITQACLSNFREPAIGYYTWLTRRMFALDGRMDDMLFGRTENLREDLLWILAQTGTQIGPQLREAILSAPAVNASVRTPYRESYDDELRAKVAEKEKELIETFDYRFE